MPVKHIFLMSVLLAVSACSKAPPSFDAQLEKHLSAVQNRDLAAYRETITKSANLPLIFPDGTAMLTRNEVVAFHEGWFSNKDWRMSYEPVSKIVGQDMATVLLHTRYQDTPEGKPRFGYVSLTFQLQDGEWRLVQDQNTRIVSTVSTKD